MAAIAPARDQQTGRTTNDLGADPAPADVIGESLIACFRIESDGSLRLLAPEPAVIGRPIPPRN